MKRAILAAGSLAAMMLMMLGAGSAFADTVQLDHGIGPQTLYKMCDQQGGDFRVSGTHGTYSCTKKDCDGQGGDCTVECQQADESCTGSTPGMAGPHETLRDLLTNHYIPLLDDPDTGTPPQNSPAPTAPKPPGVILR